MLGKEEGSRISLRGIRPVRRAPSRPAAIGRDSRGTREFRALVPPPPRAAG